MNASVFAHATSLQAYGSHLLAALARAMTSNNNSLSQVEVSMESSEFRRAQLIILAAFVAARMLVSERLAPLEVSRCGGGGDQLSVVGSSTALRSIAQR